MELIWRNELTFNWIELNQIEKTKCIELNLNSIELNWTEFDLISIEWIKFKLILPLCFSVYKHNVWLGNYEIHRMQLIPLNGSELI